MKKLSKFNFCKNFTKVHNIYRKDGLDKIRTIEHEQIRIINRENDIFKSWKNYLNMYYKEWIDAVYSRKQIIEPDLGENYGHFIYYNVNTDGNEILMRKDKFGNKEMVLDLKTIPFLKDINSTVLKTMRISQDQNKISFIVDLENNEKYFGGIYDFTSKTYLDEKFINVSNIEFTHDDKVIYVENNKLNRPYRIKLHKLGDNFKSDRLIYEEKDDNVYIETNTTKDHKYILINSLTKHDSKVSLIDLKDRNYKPITLFERQDGVKYFIEHSGDAFFILSNMMLKNETDYFLSTNKDYKLFSILDKDLEGRKIKLLTSPETGEYFEDMDIFKDYLVVYFKKYLSPHLLVHNLKSGENARYKIGEPGEVQPCLNKDFLSKTVRFDYSNPFIFRRTMDFDFNTKSFKIIQETKYNGKKFDASDYVLTNISAPSKDGENIPITLFHKKGLQLDRKNKVLLIGYGAYGLNLELNFDSVLNTAVDKGWVIAYAHIRGGNEKGRNWHESGLHLNKHIVIEDYIASAYALIRHGYTHPNYLAAMGSSAGGSVVAQAANYKPDLFRAVVLSHPFLDMLTTLLDDSLPLTIPDYEEYGNPHSNIDHYNNIQSISPYENISNQEYPGKVY
jgi:oligopeptidase B